MTLDAIKSKIINFKRPKALEKIPYNNQALGCVISAVLSFILLFFNLFFSVAFSLISFAFFTMTKPNSRLDYNNRWFSTLGLMLALTSLSVVLLTHIVVNSVFSIIMQ